MSGVSPSLQQACWTWGWTLSRAGVLKRAHCACAQDNFCCICVLLAVECTATALGCFLQAVLVRVALHRQVLDVRCCFVGAPC